MTLEEFRSDPDRIKAYREWLALPMTRTVLELVQQRVNGQFIAAGVPDTVETGAQLHALSYGRQEILAFITRELAQYDEAFDEPQPMYGAEKLLADYTFMGRTGGNPDTQQEAR